MTIWVAIRMAIAVTILAILAVLAILTIDLFLSEGCFNFCIFESPLITVYIRTVKFIYSEKATKFCEIFPLLLSRVHTVKIKGKISENFVAFS